MKNITFVVATCGEQTEAECLASLRLFVDKAELIVIRNVCPQVKMLNQMISQTNTEYLVPVDSDMILDHDAFDRIQRAIEKYSHDPNWHSILFPLWDTLTEEKILALKILRTSIMKQYPFNDVPTPDVEHYKRLTEAGYTCIHNYLQRPPIGKHVVRGPYFCYSKYRDVYQTFRTHQIEWDSGVFKGGYTLEEKAKKHFDFFAYKYLMTDNRDYLFCIAGMVDGLTSDLENKSKSYEKKEFKVPVEIGTDMFLAWYRSRIQFYF